MYNPPNCICQRTSHNRDIKLLTVLAEQGLHYYALRPYTKLPLHQRGCVCVHVCKLY